MVSTAYAAPTELQGIQELYSCVSNLFHETIRSFPGTW